MFNFFGKKDSPSKESLKEKLSKTHENIIDNISSLLSGVEKIDDDILDEMEEKLIMADIGLDTSVYIVESLRDKRIHPSKIKDFLKDEFKKILDEAGSTGIKFKEGLNIILVVGVNGSGKTTLIGKLAHSLKQENKKILIGAADTFRAAAEEQLEIWSKRAGADILRKDGSEPASVIFDSIKKAKEENYDFLIIDTAGRLQNKYNLMEELGKLRKIIEKNAENDLVETILVIDANTGQNGFSQAKVFKEAANASCVALTKLDGSAKGGIVLAIAKEFKLPVKIIGVGEKISDIKDFDKDEFLEALFE